MTLDRLGEPVEPEPDHDPNCKGWIDAQADHPRPCLICKPWLAPAARRVRAFGIHHKETK